MQPKLAQVTGAEILAFGPPSLPGSTGGPPLQFVIRTIADYRQLVDVMAEIETAARESGLFLFVNSDLKFDMPQIDFKIDANKANSLGISMQDIGSSLATLLGGNYVNRFSLNSRSYQVIPQAPRDFRLTPDWLTRYQLRTRSGALVSLATVASLSTTVQPNGLPTFQQLNAATLQGVPFPGHTLGEAIGFLQQKDVYKRQVRTAIERVLPEASRLSAKPCVDYAAVAALKGPLFDAAHMAFRDFVRSHPRDPLVEDFEAFVRAGGETLRRFAIFSAIEASLGVTQMCIRDRFQRKTI